MAAEVLKILLLLAAFCAGCAQLPSQCNGVDIPLTRDDVLITLSPVNCFRCDLPGGGITWTLDILSIGLTATSFTNSDGTTSLASTVNSYLVLTNPQSFVTPGRAGRVDIQCQDANNDEIDTRLLSPELADPVFSPQTVNERGTLRLRCVNNVPENVGTTEIFNPDGVSVAPVSYEVEDVTRDKAGNYSCVVTAVILPNTTRTVFTTVTIQFQSTFPTVPGQGVNCTVMGDYFVCSALPGATVMLNCSVDANPPATVTFSPQGVNTVGNTIVINNFTEAANYSCTATNEGFDPVTRNFRVVVGGLPVSVSGAVTVTFDESAETVTFSWTYDNTMNIIPATSFNVTITPVNGGTPITRTVNINDLSLTLSFSDLMSETDYTVSVVAVNQLGGSVAIGNTFESPETSNAQIAVASYMLSVLMIAVLALFF